VNNIRSTLATVWRIAAPYFNSEDKWAGRGLLAIIILMELTLVANSVLFNQWRANFYNAMQERDWDGFVRQFFVFCLLATMLGRASDLQALSEPVAADPLAPLDDQPLSRRLAARCQPLSHAIEGRFSRQPGPTRQRRRQAVRRADALDQHRAAHSVVTIMSFLVVLWNLSAAAPLQVYGHDLTFPGYLLWTALIYAIFGTAFTHWIGLPLVGLNFEQQRLEADFRFQPGPVAENAEQIALLKAAAPNERGC